MALELLNEDYEEKRTVSGPQAMSYLIEESAKRLQLLIAELGLRIH